jgi:formylglycine-generating enzyme required for sulfatase activity
MDRTEVTVSAYKRCSDSGECRRASTTNEWSNINAADHETYDPLCNVRDPEGRAEHPINCVDWRMADDYCRVHAGRLPTEAEWELAARGPDGRTYPWGDEAPSGSLLNACGSECASWGRTHHAEVRAMYLQNDGWPTTAPVGSFPRGSSRYGMQDVVGNVWEWVADYYASYSDRESADPRGPDSGKEHVIRGGGWNGSDPAWVRPTFRYKDDAEKKSHGIGFRCAASPARP